MKIRFQLLIAIAIIFAASSATADNCYQKFQTQCQDQWVAMLAGSGAGAFHKCVADNRKGFGRSCYKMVDLTVKSHADYEAGERVRYPGEYRVKRAEREIKRYDIRARGLAGTRYRK